MLQNTWKQQTPQWWDWQWNRVDLTVMSLLLMSMLMMMKMTIMTMTWKPQTPQWWDWQWRNLWALVGPLLPLLALLPSPLKPVDDHDDYDSDNGGDDQYDDQWWRWSWTSPGGSMGMETWPGVCISVDSVPRQACVPFITYSTNCIRVYTSGYDLNHKGLLCFSTHSHVSMRHTF